MAGRPTPGMVLRQTLDIAIRAPVLPPETAKPASPAFTAAIASHMLDFPRPLRSASLGLASIGTARSVCVSLARAPSAGCVSSTGRTRASSPNSRYWDDGWRDSVAAAAARTTSGPRSPPIASSAIVIGLVMLPRRAPALRRKIQICGRQTRPLQPQSPRAGRCGDQAPFPDSDFSWLNAINLRRSSSHSVSRTCPKLSSSVRRLTPASSGWSRSTRPRR